MGKFLMCFMFFSLCQSHFKEITNEKTCLKSGVYSKDLVKALNIVAKLGINIE